MSTYRLDRMFAPRSVALVGASPREHSVGRTILRNLLAAGFRGPIHLINPNYPAIEGIAALRSLDDLPSTDLLIVAAPPAAVPGIVASAGARGCPAAVIITSGLGSGSGSLTEATERAARNYGMRLLGPNCLGIQVPRVRLDATFAAHMTKPGDLALISQSGAVAAGLIEWSMQHSLGFSAVVSMGNQIDVDFGDLLDYFAVDAETRAILFYVESIQEARKFMSAARAAARTKPVVVIKAGRHALGAAAARTHTGALAGSDAVYDAAFRRAGLVRVFDMDELFDAAETLGRLKSFPGDRLAILTNGGGIGVLAVDRLIDLGGKLASLSGETIATLDRILPPIWSRANPVDIAGDADAKRYSDALEVLLADPGSDAILAMNVPTALASSADAAAAVVSTVRAHRDRGFPDRPVFGVWIGDQGEAKSALESADIPHYPSESSAIRGFMHLVRYREGQDALLVTPPSVQDEFAPNVEIVRHIVERAVTEGRRWLDPLEISDVLGAYSIPSAETILAHDPNEAALASRPLLARGMVAVKILSQDIVHKSDVGGVRLNLTDEKAVHDASADILARARNVRPDARIRGVTVHPMIVRPQARELIAGIADDAIFGPVIVFGSGGTAVEVINDKALALPPLNLKLAHDLIGQTRVSRILMGYRDVSAADLQSLALILVKLSQLAADVPEIRELDLNPLLADHNGVIVLDARVAVSDVGTIRSHGAGNPRFAIRPYPKGWERVDTLRDGTALLLRPVRPEDAPLYPPFLQKISEEDLRLRFFAPIKNLGHAFIARLTQIDYARAMAFVALDQSSGEMLGVARLHTMTYSSTAEFAILVRSDFKGRGLGWQLMQRLIEYARTEGIETIMGEVLAENTVMLRMCAELGFQISVSPGDRGLRAVMFKLDHSQIDK